MAGRDRIELAVHPEFIQTVQSDPKKTNELVKCGRDFRYFLKYWKFRNQETGEIQVLGDVVWEGQEQLIEAIVHQPWVFAFKARKLGFTTIGEAYDGWVARFRDVNARVHLFSRRDDAAKELLEAVKFGLERLPEWMQLPYTKQPTLQEIRFRGINDDDVRIVKAYPTGKETAVESTCNHGHVDEWARMDDPKAVWQAIQPSMAGSCHFITTGRGPTNYASTYYRMCETGDAEHVPIFVDALARPDRDWPWLRKKRKGMTEQAGKQEFPMTPEDAMSGGGRFVFRGPDVDLAGGGLGSQPAQKDHRYVKAWDIGRHHDAAVGVVIDTSVTPYQVVHYVRLRGVPYPHLQARIERVHASYPGPTVIEKNGPGEAVAENLDIPERELRLFNTSKKSKARILEELQLGLEQRGIQWSKEEWPQLDSEVRSYQLPDKHIVQDSVMALAIGNTYVPEAQSALGRVGSPVRW